MDTPNFSDGIEDKPNFDRRPRMPAGVAVNGPRLQAFRLQAGLTQEQLARLSGFSDRLIRKAESSGLLRLSTIQILAKTLCERGLKVTADDLTFAPGSVAVEICKRLFSAGPQEFDQLSAQIHREFELLVAGEGLSIPFSGTFSGIRGLRQFMTLLHRTIEVSRPSESVVKTYSSANEELVAFVTRIRAVQSQKSDTASVWWYFQFRFEGSVVHSMSIYFDTGIICRLFGTPPTSP